MRCGPSGTRHRTQAGLILLRELSPALATRKFENVVGERTSLFRRRWNHAKRGGILILMHDVTQFLAQIENGDPSAADELLPLVYAELRQLAAARMAQERPDHTLQSTALVHEAYLRLVGSPNGKHWENRRHFFAAAAEAMRRILVDSARRRQSAKRGGDRDRVPLDASEMHISVPPAELLSIDEAISKLAEDDAQAAELVKLRYFLGLPLNEAAEMMGISRATAVRYWAYAKSFLACELRIEIA
jgi:RNA polymerase sigma factor (TIGR02999 family)